MEDFNFSSDVVYENLDTLKATYPFLQVGSAGKSVLGKDIPFVRIGRGQKEVFYSSAIHANEWITSILLLEFMYEYCSAIQNNSTIWGFSAKNLFESTSIYIMPIVNPDGVGLSFIGIFYVCFNSSFNSIFSFTYSLIQFNLLNAKWI